MIGGEGFSIYGRADAEPRELRSALEEGNGGRLGSVSGAFALVLRERGRTTVFVSSSYLRPIYLCVRRDLAPLLGHALPEISAAAETGWSWDFDAVADYLIVGHTISGRSLHSRIRKLPACAIVQVDHRSGAVATDRPLVATHTPTTYAAALEALEAAVAACTDCVSVSGGLDSRLLLACMLSSGRRPRLIISGTPDCFDRQAADWIAREFGLALHCEIIDAADIKTTARTAAMASNGLLPLTHWAGLTHLKGANETNVVMGLNGECVRTYYSTPNGDDDRDAQITAILSKQSVRLSAEERAFLTPELAGSVFGVRDRLGAALPLANPSAALGDFFAEQYATNKSGADAAAVAGAFGIELQIPFSDAKWRTRAEGLPADWRIGDRFHLSAIRDIFPALLNFPFVASNPREEPYIDQSIFVDEGVLGLLTERRDLILPLINADGVDKIVEDFVRDRLRPHLVFSLLSLALFIESME